jgi:alpha-beta hydrolase superfamily lysophospholipase
VPGPDHVLFQAGLANFNPHAASTVNFHNDNRAPLLLVAGGQDHISPPSVVRANFNLYRKAKAVTDYKEYPERTHYTLGELGWEQVADFSLDWAVRHATADAIKRQAAAPSVRSTPAATTGPDGASTTPTTPA